MRDCDPRRTEPPGKTRDEFSRAAPARENSLLNSRKIWQFRYVEFRENFDNHKYIIVYNYYFVVQKFVFRDVFEIPLKNFQFKKIYE